ncbi:MAG: transcription antitermination factor NusB [Planctomycetota bacterium]|jgi:16S rRNA (cytosine967-C5)-methyltransferase
MKKRDPLRFRKSELSRRRPASKQQRGDQSTPKAATARQLAFSIIDEYRRTGTFVGQLLEERLDGERRDFLKRPPLAGRLSRPQPKTAKPQTPRQKIKLSQLDRRLVTQLVYGVVRRQDTLDAILNQFVTRGRAQTEPELWTLLQLGVYQLVLTTGIPQHAAVHETVQLSYWLRQSRWSGFLNGILRSIGRDVTEEFLEAPASDAVPIECLTSNLQTSADEPTVDDVSSRHTQVRYRRFAKQILPDPTSEPHEYIARAFGLPLWLIDRWSKRFSNEELFQLAEWFERRQPLSLRVNQRHGTRDELLARFAEALGPENENDFGPGRIPESIFYDGSLRVVDLPGFSDGDFTVQDETAMSASLLLNPLPGETVLDLCAAPGTKTTHLAELMNNDGRIVATDVDGRRLRRVEENARRLQFDIIEPLRIQPDLSEFPTGPFDAILIDAPCSNTGVIGKRPEVRSRIGTPDIDELGTLQLKLLTESAKHVAPTGRIVYSTCSIEPEENAEVVSAFLSEHPDFELAETREILPGHPSDGGYQALLVRKPQP